MEYLTLGDKKKHNFNSGMQRKNKKVEASENHRYIESFRLEKVSKIVSHH